MPKTKYQCIRCGYWTPRKSNIQNHFGKKKPCPTSLNDIELTDEIKQHIINYQVYHIKTEAKTSNVINNFNILNNFVTGMEYPDKLNHLLTYYDKQLIDFEDSLESKYAYRNNRLEYDKVVGGYFMDVNDFLKLINDATQGNSDYLENFNVFYHKALKRFQFFRGNNWESFIEDIGARELVSLIKSYFLDNYEIYLLRHLHRDVNQQHLNRIKVREHLEIYYRFISTFDLLPKPYEWTDVEILGHRLSERDDSVLGLTYMKIYQEQKSQVKSCEKAKIKRKIVDIIKQNSIFNVSVLNKAILEILKIDDEFRTGLIGDLSMLKDD